jgi:hypothetical protein
LNDIKTFSDTSNGIFYAFTIKKIVTIQKNWQNLIDWSVNQKFTQLIMSQLSQLTDHERIFFLTIISTLVDIYSLTDVGYLLREELFYVWHSLIQKTWTTSSVSNPKWAFSRFG